MTKNMGNPDSGQNTDPPMQIGRYAVKRELGRGGMGVVYLAHDADLERDVAIKTLPGVDETNPDRLRRFEREAKVLAAINHPNIATIYAIDKTDDGLRFIVLEYVEGETLGRVLKKNAVNLRQAIELCTQTARAIAAAHAKGIVHRDIKPGNVMVTPDMTVKVLDFGLSMRESTGAADIDVTRTVQTMPGQVMGTPGYMSPEQARGKPVDKRADIWSFGCILFQTLTGAPAFQGDTSTDIIASTLHNDPNWNKLPANTPRNLRELLQRMLAKNAEDRLDDMSVAIKVLTESIHRFSATGSATAAHYGSFEAVKELDSSSHASIWEVKPATGKYEQAKSQDGKSKSDDGVGPSSQRYVAKIVEPPSVNLAPDQTMRLLDTFRSGTTVQKMIADAPGVHHWAKILDHGQFPGGAYYITEHVDHTLSQLLARGAGPTSSELHSIIQGIVGALLELDRLLQRPHGNLKPSNILLREDHSSAASDEARWAVLLTDPASDSDLETAGKRIEDDLNEIGKLLYQLVEGEHWSGQDGERVPLTNAWKRLGRIGEQMHALCTTLLAAEPPSLQDVAARLERMAPQRKPLAMKPLIAAALTLLLLAVGVWFAYTTMTSTPGTVAINGEDGPDVVAPPQPPGPKQPPSSVTGAQREYEAARANWLNDLIGDPPAVPFEMLEQVGGGGDLRRSITNVGRLDPSRLSGGYSDAMLLVNGLRNELRTQLVESARGLATVWDGLLRWTSAAQELRVLAADIGTLLDANEVVQFDDNRSFADLVTRLEEQLRKRQREDEWERLDRRANELANELPEHGLDDDPILRRMKESIGLEFGAVAIDDIDHQLEAWSEAITMLEAALLRVSDVDMAYMREQYAAYERADNPEGLRRQHFVAWADEINSGRYDIPRDDPRDDPQLVTSLDEQRRQLHDLREQFLPEACPDIEQPAERGVEAIQQQLDAMEWDQSHATRDRMLDQIETLQTALRREIDDWDQVVVACRSGCEAELDMLLGRGLSFRELPATAERLLEPARQQWEMIRDNENLQCDQRRDVARHLAQFAQRINEHLFEPAAAPADLPSTIDPAQVEAVLQQKWDEKVEPILRGALDADWQVGVGRDNAMWSELEAARAAYQQWQQDARQLLADYRDIDQRLNLAFGWEQVRGRFQPGGNPWPESPIYADLSQPLDELSRITRDAEKLRDMEDRQVTAVADAQQLLPEVANEAETPAYRWAAWRRLADAASFRNSLDWETMVAPHIETLLSEIGRVERVRSSMLENNWRIGRRERWVVNAAAADDSQWLRDAFDRMEAFGITDPAAHVTHPRLRFNLDLNDLRERVRQFVAAEEHDEDALVQLQHMAREMADRIDAMDAPERDRGAWRELLTEIAGFDIDADDQRGPDWSEIGPAKAGWEWHRDNDGEYIRYTPPAEWTAQHGELLRTMHGNEPVLTFRRVAGGNDDDERATYLSTTEVTAGLFLTLAKAMGAEGVLRSDLLGEGSDGARVWEWRGDGMELSADVWMTAQNRVENDMPPPGASFPMQYITPAAAIAVARQFGCRLPTESEWRRAVQIVARERGEIQANLRGQNIGELINRAEALNRERPFDRIRTPDWDSTTLVLRGELSGMADADTNDAVFRNIQPSDQGWFQPVDTGSSEFQHIIGNVAEFILTDTIDRDALAELPDPIEQPKAFVDGLHAIAVPDGREGDINLRIIGGSIFSAMDVHPLLQAVPYARGRHLPTHVNQQFYSDVGFRLAFDSSAQLSGEQQFLQLVKRVLDDREREPFLLALGQ